MRGMMLERARTSGRKKLIAPCCCSRMTSDEALMMQAIGGALRSPRSAYEDVAALLGNDHALGALTCLQAVAQAPCDLGRPLDQIRERAGSGKSVSGSVDLGGGRKIKKKKKK